MLIVVPILTILIAFQLRTIEFKIYLAALALLDGSIGISLWAYFGLDRLKAGGGVAQV